ncbi:MAG: PIN domain-containing protein [Candidatus Limnocylindrales bacterium]
MTVLDSSVLIALVDASDAHHIAARAAIRSARDAGDEFVVPVAAYAEFMVRSYQDDVSMIAFRDGLVDAIPARVEPATRETGRQAAAIRARNGQRVKLPDALIIATAIVVGADRILTADARWPAQDVPVTILLAP